ncbi:hypothetical protein [Halorussus caseinilyticus]|uniref:Uncharacterized protein n=1 Tax=Halorussus caseinilyticus TaxID=3034025 RepID=A0ABD5WNV5_9EURY|nr:hypothetical protein [Halorussus sp. DT72]
MLQEIKKLLARDAAAEDKHEQRDEERARDRYFLPTTPSRQLRTHS